MENVVFVKSPVLVVMPALSQIEFFIETAPGSDDFISVGSFEYVNDRVLDISTILTAVVRNNSGIEKTFPNFSTAPALQSYNQILLKAKYRIREYDGDNWGDWTEVDAFDCLLGSQRLEDYDPDYFADKEIVMLHPGAVYISRSGSNPLLFYTQDTGTITVTVTIYDLVGNIYSQTIESLPDFAGGLFMYIVKLIPGAGLNPYLSIEVVTGQSNTFTSICKTYDDKEGPVLIFTNSKGGYSALPCIYQVNKSLQSSAELINRNLKSDFNTGFGQKLSKISEWKVTANAIFELSTGYQPVNEIAELVQDLVLSTDIMIWDAEKARYTSVFLERDSIVVDDFEQLQAYDFKIRPAYDFKRPI